MVNLTLPLRNISDIPSTMPSIPEGIVGGFHCWVDEHSVLCRILVQVVDGGEAIVHNLLTFDAHFVAIFGLEQVDDGLVMGEHSGRLVRGYCGLGGGVVKNRSPS